VSLPVFLRTEAETDIRQAQTQLEAIRPKLAQQFLAHLRNLLERVETQPEMYGIIWKDVRAARLKRFRYVVYYVVLPEKVVVLAVMHGARNASEWQSRTFGS
jgi:toxin ParE1/3/4